MITIDEFLERNKDVIKNGWVAYDIVWGWQWFSHKPKLHLNDVWISKKGEIIKLEVFDILQRYPSLSLKRIRKI